MNRKNDDPAIRRVEIAVCKHIEVASKRDGRILPRKVGVEVANQFLAKAKSDPELFEVFVALAGAKLVEHFCDMPRGKWPISSNLPNEFLDLPFAVAMPGKPGAPA